jgi:organic radical activating enzyme
MSKKEFEEIDKVSASFCLAKWKQVTIDLVHGTNHSCHHPIRHIIPLDQLENNPSVLHNTPYKKEQRKMMLEGTRPAECQYCWKIEDHVDKFASDRFVKSTDPWAYPHLETVKKSSYLDDFNPSYLEVMFDNFCNFSCAYCTADISTSIAKEMSQFGVYRVGHKAHRDFDPDWSPRNTPENREKLRKAFWSWFPNLLSDLDVLRVTGGEPFLSADTLKLLNFLSEQEEKTNLQLAINSNLGFSHKHLNNYLDQIDELLINQKIGSFEFYVSIDTFGEQAEYLRKGLDYNEFIKNLELSLKRLGGQRVVLMVAYNVLSIPKFDLLLKEVIGLKKQYPNLVFDISYVKNPDYLRAHIIESSWYPKMESDLQLMKENFSDYEYRKFERIIKWIVSGDHSFEEINKSRADFFSFIHEYDKRFGLSFSNTFPELRSLMGAAKKSSFQLIGVHPPLHS